jgi:hypothetical protein
MVTAVKLAAVALLAVAFAPAAMAQVDYASQMEGLAQRHAGDLRASSRSDHEGARREAMAQQMLVDMLRDVSAMLDHGSPTAKEAAVARLLQMAVETSSGSMFHPTTFRNAAIRSGVVPKIIALMAAGSDHAKYLGAGALQALALDDPTTTLDNGHQVRALGASARARAGLGRMKGHGLGRGGAAAVRSTRLGARAARARQARCGEEKAASRVGPPSCKVAIRPICVACASRSLARPSSPRAPVLPSRARARRPRSARRAPCQFWWRCSSRARTGGRPRGRRASTSSCRPRRPPRSARSPRRSSAGARS